ncbi:unnamed protein product [Urochloa humidicola]
MAYHVEQLHSVKAVDDTINREADSGSGRLVVVRFGRGGHPDCARLDAALATAAEQVADVAALAVRRRHRRGHGLQRHVRAARGALHRHVLLRVLPCSSSTRQGRNRLGRLHRP